MNNNNIRLQVTTVTPVPFMAEQNINYDNDEDDDHCDQALVAQLVEHQAAMQEVVSSTPAGPTLRVFK